mmetsp:Transcript_71788/g.114265  ORF Transcript_71788/g.114265 Transcript_71788/m.114265 type:complete len:238 (-) Transcript_71788:158-871(-)
MRGNRRILNYLAAQPAKRTATLDALHMIAAAVLHDTKFALRTRFAAIAHLLHRHLVDLGLFGSAQLVRLTRFVHGVRIAVIHTVLFAARTVAACDGVHVLLSNRSGTAIRTLPRHGILQVALEALVLAPRITVHQLVYILLVDIDGALCVVVVVDGMETLQVDHAVADLGAAEVFDALDAIHMLAVPQTKALVHWVLHKADVAEIRRFQLFRGFSAIHARYHAHHGLEAAHSAGRLI